MKLNILLLCNKPPAGNDANTIAEHIEAIETYSAHQIWVLSNMGDLPRKLNLARFDVIIIHYSICMLGVRYLSKKAKHAIAHYQGLKLAFIQDEYRRINQMNQTLASLGVDVLYTCFPEDEINKIYHAPGLASMEKHNNLTGYISDKLLSKSKNNPINERNVHIAYRGRKTPFWLGELTFGKWDIVEKWQQFATCRDFVTDMSYHEKDRIYGDKWYDFITSCKATLGVESGSSVVDFTGEIEQKVNLHELIHPDDSFADVQKKHLLEHEGKHKLNQISPRCFEAIVFKTVLVLYEGEYSDILTPWRHYIPLKKDFSNINQVLDYLRDDAFLQNMADTAYQEVALNPNYHYKQFIKSVDGVIEQAFRSRNKHVVTHPYQRDRFQQHATSPTLKNRLIEHVRRVYLALPPHIKTLANWLFSPRMALKFVGKKIVAKTRRGAC